MAKWYGPNFPFYKNTGGLVADRQEDNRLIKNDFLQGIMTIVGERWFRPNFGGNIRMFVFDPNDSTSRTSLENAIRRQAELFHPRVIIDSIGVEELQNNPNAVLIKIFGKTALDATNTETLLASFQVPIAGTLGGGSLGEGGVVES